MKKRVLLEMSVESLDAAVAAVRGGADRIELCQNLSAGGVTPSADMMREARQRFAVPIFAMIRPREGDFVYAAAEFEEMKRQIEQAHQARMHGVVLGILTRDGGVDVARNAVLVELAKPMPVTFHRAFDHLTDLQRGLEDLVAAGAARVLTSGGKATAEEGCETIARLVRQGGARLLILPGGGIRPENLSRILRETQPSEVHSGLSHLLSAMTGSWGRFEAAVRDLARVLEEESRNLQPVPGSS